MTFTEKPAGAHPNWTTETARVNAFRQWDKKGRSGTRRNIRRRERAAELRDEKMLQESDVIAVAQIQRRAELYLRKQRRKVAWNGMMNHKG